MFASFAAVERFLNATTDYERQAARYDRSTYDLDRMRRLVEALGRPDRAFRSLHVAGTKGKGSVCHMAEAMLREAGYRTGLYTSPHLVHMRERIRLDGVPVSERELVRAMNRMERALRRLRPTYFEILTAAAFVVFAAHRVGYAVIEVGLGGRLDATNVITPVACAITTIGYDHQDKLGRTLGEIAREKAGILKPGIPSVSSPQRPAAMREILRKSRPLVPRIQVFGAGRVIKFMAEGIGRCTLPAPGVHQAVNAGTAIALVRASGADVTPAALRRALARVRLPGRIEVVGRRPWVVVDCAHNPLSARALADGIRRWPPGRRTILVFGASADKDVRGMMRALGGADLAVFTRAASPRAADPRALARLWGRPALVAGTVAGALETARALARPDDRVVVAGSFYVAGEALAALGE
jgi:dihydrofolate synthase/folylpolyglutamate synthase